MFRFAFVLAVLATIAVVSQAATTIVNPNAVSGPHSDFTVIAVQLQCDEGTTVTRTFQNNELANEQYTCVGGALSVTIDTSLLSNGPHRVCYDQACADITIVPLVFSFVPLATEIAALQTVTVTVTALPNTAVAVQLVSPTAVIYSNDDITTNAQGTASFDVTLDTIGQFVGVGSAPNFKSFSTTLITVYGSPVLVAPDPSAVFVALTATPFTLTYHMVDRPTDANHVARLVPTFSGTLSLRLFDVTAPNTAVGTFAVAFHNGVGTVTLTVATPARYSATVSLPFIHPNGVPDSHVHTFMFDVSGQLTAAPCHVLDCESTPVTDAFATTTVSYTASALSRYGVVPAASPFPPSCNSFFNFVYATASWAQYPAPAVADATNPPCLSDVTDLTFSYSDGRDRVATYRLKALSSHPSVTGFDAAQLGNTPYAVARSFGVYQLATPSSTPFIAPYSAVGIRSFTMGGIRFDVNQKESLEALIQHSSDACWGVRVHRFVVDAQASSGSVRIEVGVQETSILD